MPRSTTPRVTKKKAPARTRAFLFSDLRDYTSYVEAKGDAAAARLLKDYRTLVRREVARHEGAEVKTEGDSFYVVFTAPSAALDCAVAILRAADVRSAKDPTAPLRIGVGLHAGETVEYDDQFVGSAVNIASRLAGKASAGELLISDTLRGLVRTSTALHMTERGPLELKGVSEHVRAWSVTWQTETQRAAPVAPPPTAAPRKRGTSGQFLCPIVVGRTIETGTFTARLASASEGEGSAVLLSGEAGVGKSAFVRQATDLATARGFRILTGLTHQSDSGLPYAPFISAIRSGFRGLDRDELGRVLQRSAPDLAELFPELGRTARPAEPTGVERHRLSVAFQHLFLAFARETPVMVILEDLHWADEASLDLLRYLARELRDGRILILGTYRSDEMHRRHPLLAAITELQRERLVTEIALKRLTPDETRELIRATFAPTHPTISVSEAFRDAIYERSEGNPFFTEELLKALVESGGVYYTEGQGWDRKPIEELEIPGSIREAVRARIERLTPEARATLSAAAAVGHRFPFDLLRSVRGIDEQQLESQVREFIEEQLVVEAQEDEDYSFRHALTREVVYDDLLVRERKRLHRAVAEQLESQPAAEPALLAHHLVAAGETARAVPVLLEAARRAQRTDAPREAVAHLERALEIGVPDPELATTLEQLAEAYHLFDIPRSYKAAMEAATCYRERDDRRGNSRMLRLASRDRWLQGEGVEARGLARGAIDILQGVESVELARATAHLAGLHMTDGALAEADALSDRAIDLARRLGDPWAEANALITKGSSTRDDDLEVSLGLTKAGIELAKKHGLATTAARGMNNALITMNVIGLPVAERRAWIEDGVRWSQEHGLERSQLAFPYAQWSWLDTNEGDFDAAEAKIEIVERSDTRMLGHAQRLIFALGRRGPEDVRPLVLRFAEHAEKMGDVQVWVPAAAFNALLYAMWDDLSTARSWLDRAHERFTRPNAPLDTLGVWSPILTCAAFACDDARWPDLFDRVPALSAKQRRHAEAVSAHARALLVKDMPRAAETLVELWDAGTHMSYDFPSAFITVNDVYIARRRGLALGEAWRVPVMHARVFAEKAKATWWLEQLAKAELA